MAVANDKWNYIFLAEPHTASRAVRVALLQVEGAYKAGSHHTTVEELFRRKCTRRRQRSRYTTFSVIRNPADILVTRWLRSPMWLHNQLPLQDYLFLDSKKTTSFFRHASTADHVVRYENLQEGLNCLLRQFHSPSVQLDVIGQTPDKVPWFRYYTVNDLWFILGGYPDIARWGYTEEIHRQIDAKNRKKA